MSARKMLVVLPDVVQRSQICVSHTTNPHRRMHGAHTEAKLSCVHAPHSVPSPLETCITSVGSTMNRNIISKEREREREKQRHRETKRD